MIEKILQEKYMVFLRYGYILFFIISFAKEYEKIGLLEIVFLLAYIINNQIRYFIFPKKDIYIVPSIIVEILLCYTLYSFAGVFGALIFIPTLIDIIYMFKSSYAIIYMIIVILSMASLRKLDFIISYSVVALPIFLLLVRLKEEEERKIQAQQLYDSLREKDEELKRLNKELEVHVNTIEEIAVLRERNRISREIHDSVGHALATIIIQLGAIEKIAKVNGAEASKMAINLGDFAKESMERVRTAVRDMKPREFEEYEGIIAVSEMIKNFEKLTGIEVSLRISDKLWSLNSDQTMVIYRVIQEFLSNSLKHGKATKVKVLLNFLEGGLRVYLKDNGVGCSQVVSNVGLRSIKERAAVWGGTVEYFSEEGKGFELIVNIDKAKLSLDGA